MKATADRSHSGSGLKSVRHRQETQHLKDFLILLQIKILLFIIFLLFLLFSPRHGWNPTLQAATRSLTLSHTFRRGNIHTFFSFSERRLNLISNPVMRLNTLQRKGGFPEEPRHGRSHTSYIMSPDRKHSSDGRSRSGAESQHTCLTRPETCPTSRLLVSYWLLRGGKVLRVAVLKIILAEEGV